VTFCTAATAASGASATCSSFARSCVVLALPAARDVTSTERPSLEMVFRALGGDERALDVRAAVDLLEALHDVLDGRGDLRIRST